MLKYYPCHCICGCTNIVTGVGEPRPGTPDMLCLPCWDAGVQHGDHRHRAKEDSDAR